MGPKAITLTGIISLLIFSGGLRAQSEYVNGKLTLFNTYPLSNVEVTTKKAKISTTTDTSGLFYLEADKRDLIQVRDRVFQPASLRLTGDEKFLEINLIFKDTPRNRKLAVENGYISKENLLYGLAHLQDENNDYCNYNDIFSLIRHQFPELDVRRTSTGEMGVYMNRGQKSLVLETNALYIVDGARLNSINHINPCEVAKITIKKGGAAAIYGAGSRNGAVVIETKGARQ